MVTSESHDGFFSVGTRLAAGTIAVLTLACSVVFFKLATRERERILDDKRVAAAMVTSLFATSVAAPLDFGDADAVDVHLHYVRENPAVVRASVWAAGATTPIASSPPGLLQPVPADVNEPIELVRDDEVEAIAPIISRRGIKLGVARVVFSLAKENAALAANRRGLLYLSVLLAVVTGGLLIVFARRLIVAPLEKLAHAARRVEAGATSAPVDLDSRDEIGRLARAWNAMGTAVEDRERRLADREKRLADANKSLHELLDHMRQAIVVMGPDGAVHDEQSRMAGAIFGQGALEGRLVAELLYPDRQEWDTEILAFQKWAALAFDIDPTEWNRIADLAPTEVCLRAGTPDASILELEFRPIAREGAVFRVMMLATNVTEERKLEGIVRNQEQRHARQIATMRRLLGGGSQGFVDFLSRVRAELEGCEDFAERASRRVSVEDVESIFREVHTLRGEANVFDIADLAAEAVAMETSLLELRKVTRAGESAAPHDVLAEFRQRTAAARAALNRSEQMFVDMAPAGRLALEQVVVRRSHLERLEALVGTRKDELGMVVSMLAARPIGEIADRLIDQTPAWAEKEGKKVRLELDGRETLVSQRLAQMLPGVLTHLVRNAIAHGIERPDDRRSAGKPEMGTIRIECRSDTGGAWMLISDDGAGIDARAVVAAAKDRGIPAPVRLDDERALTDLLFAEGLTTEAHGTELAGRGVGLGAVRRHLSAEGYDIVMKSVRGRGTTILLEPNSRRQFGERAS